MNRLIMHCHDWSNQIRSEISWHFLDSVTHIPIVSPVFVLKKDFRVRGRGTSRRDLTGGHDSEEDSPGVYVTTKFCHVHRRQSHYISA